ncbi:MAG: A/G-specific adenine glycosylase [Dorea sp.]|nr:A/G-specific adenine glycosylase [Dorea sp.]
MKYKNMTDGTFIERPNRFIAKILVDGKEETVHVKNTGRCKELLQPGAKVYLQASDNPARKTKYDLIAVEKGTRIVNMDSQTPNVLAREWIEEGNLFEKVTLIRPEYTYGASRFDLYVEADGKKIFIEVKGVTLEEEGRVRFPDAPSERAVKHLRELMKATEDGYDCYVFFVIQMKGVDYFTPNEDTHPEFCQALREAYAAGVHVLAYECEVHAEEIHIAEAVPVVLENAALYGLVKPSLDWYLREKRDLPWRKTKNPYHIWVSEIMLQQTRVEAVKPYYARFLATLPEIKDLAEAEEDTILKLWEGLGYYNRVRNMQKAARQVMVDYNGTFPGTFEEILSLQGIGNYTAGAIGSIAFDLRKPAADGNVLRVISRVLGSYKDIMKQSVRKEMEEAIEAVIPAENPGDFNQALIELGALVCVPNGQPHCTVCPLAFLCTAYKKDLTAEIPVKAKKKERKIEKRTVFIFKDGKRLAIHKRDRKGLLAGLYEFPNIEGHLSLNEATEYAKKIGLMPVRVKKLEKSKHIFTHMEWHMDAYEIIVDELEKTNQKDYAFILPEDIGKTCAIPSAFAAYVKYTGIR